ncbi:Protein of unknown function [Gryllus bimaculatus]|nr:Protein of unknown function [Gryllus bimaculatus]
MTCGIFKIASVADTQRILHWSVADCVGKASTKFYSYVLTLLIITELSNYRTPVVVPKRTAMLLDRIMTELQHAMGEGGSAAGGGSAGPSSSKAPVVDLPDTDLPDRTTADSSNALAAKRRRTRFECEYFRNLDFRLRSSAFVILEHCNFMEPRPQLYGYNVQRLRIPDMFMSWRVPSCRLSNSRPLAGDFLSSSGIFFLWNILKEKNDVQEICCELTEETGGGRSRSDYRAKDMREPCSVPPGLGCPCTGTQYSRSMTGARQINIPENSWASSVSVVFPEIPPTKMRFGTNVPYFGALFEGGCVLLGFTGDDGVDEAEDPSVVQVLAGD